jgi:hypothetical protein
MGDDLVRFRRSPNCLWRSFAGEVLLSGEDREIRTMAGTAAEVWSVLREPMTAEEVATRLTRIYQAPSEVIARDVAALLGELENLGYVDQVSYAF